jgi:2'-5' RNA ligase
MSIMLLSVLIVVVIPQVKDGVVRERLGLMVRDLRGVFSQKGFTVEGGDDPFTPHVTLLKTSKARNAVTEANR